MAKDTPDTIYECPICLRGLTLKKIIGHFNRHIANKLGSVTLEEEGYVYGTLYVAEKVLWAHGITPTKMLDYEIICPLMDPTLKQYGYGPDKGICQICQGDGGAAGQCYKCGGTGWA